MRVVDVQSYLGPGELQEILVCNISFTLRRFDRATIPFAEISDKNFCPYCHGLLKVAAAKMAADKCLDAEHKTEVA